MPQWKSYDSSIRLISAILAAHPELKLNYQQISVCFGGDCTKSALENRFRVIKTDAKRIKDAVDKGVDPITLKLNGAKEIAQYYGEGTASSLDHRFRPIKKAAQAMRDGIAEQYGEGVTAKAVSTRFERLKKEPAAVGNSNAIPSGSSATSTPKKRTYNKKANGSTPSKKVKKSDSEDDEDDEISDDEEDFSVKSATTTPKKEPVHRTVGGRITKAKATTPRKNGNGKVVAKTINLADEEAEEEYVFPSVEEMIGVKSEMNGNINMTAVAHPTNGNDNGYANGNGHANRNGYHEDAEMEDQQFDDAVEEPYLSDEDQTVV